MDLKDFRTEIFPKKKSNKKKQPNNAPLYTANSISVWTFQIEKQCVISSYQWRGCITTDKLTKNLFFQTSFFSGPQPHLPVDRKPNLHTQKYPQYLKHMQINQHQALTCLHVIVLFHVIVFFCFFYIPSKLTMFLLLPVTATYVAQWATANTCHVVAALCFSLSVKPLCRAMSLCCQYLL